MRSVFSTPFLLFSCSSLSFLHWLCPLGSVGLAGVALDVFPKHCYKAVKIVMATIQINPTTKIKSSYDSDIWVIAYPEARTRGTQFICLIDSLIFPSGYGGRNMLNGQHLLGLKSHFASLSRH